MDENWNIKLSDFGDAIKLDIKNGQDTIVDKEWVSVHLGSFCGTPLYVSPEMLRESVTGPGNDVWAFGVILFQMISGQVPFRDKNDSLTFERILTCTYEFPPDFPEEAKDLIS